MILATKQCLSDRQLCADSVERRQMSTFYMRRRYSEVPLVTSTLSAGETLTIGLAQELSTFRFGLQTKRRIALVISLGCDSRFT
jgi:hypothetical protein